MKNKQWMWMVMLAACTSGIAYAEMISGTVTSIDMPGQNVTLKRVDTNDMITVYIKDKVSLSEISTGYRVSLDANRKGDDWEAQSFKMSAEKSKFTDLSSSSGMFNEPNRTSSNTPSDENL